MGKARIVSGGEDGLYNVEVLVNRDRIDAELEWLAQKLAELNAELSALDAELEVARGDLAQAAADVDEKIAAHGGGVLPDVEAELTALARASGEVQKLEADRAVLLFRIMQLEARQKMLESVPADPTQQAWCADYTDDLEAGAEVGTIELPGEGVVGEFAEWRRLLIRPGYTDAAVYNYTRDGQLHHRIGMSSAQAYFNAAILPGWQKWEPLHRIGVIASVNTDEDTCTLNLQSEDSSANALLIDPPTNTLTLEDVPIEYMNCHSVVFEEGDRVLVEFEDRDWAKPRVIGFEKEPKRCYIIMAYNLGFRYIQRFFDDADPSGYPSKPAELWRNRGVTEVVVKLWGGDGQALLYDTRLAEVESAEVISEMPPFSAIGILERDEIIKGSFMVPTTTFNRNTGPTEDAPNYPIEVPWVGTKEVGSATYPNNKPSDPFNLEPESLEVTFRQYRAQSFQFYERGTFARVYWSTQVDTEQLAGQVTVTCDLEDFPETIGWNDVTYTRAVFVNFVPFDFNNDRGESDQWQLDRICIRYDAQAGGE